jgi:hypothetical protein
MTTKAVTTRLDELLEPLGFMRRKTTWNREREGLLDGNSLVGAGKASSSKAICSPEGLTN